VVYRTDEGGIYRPFMEKPHSTGTYASHATWRTYQMSDHLPMWIEPYTDFACEYLQEIGADLQARLDG